MYDFSIKESHIPLSYIIKAEDWKYEEEWRIVFMSEGLASDNHFVKIPIPTKILLGPRFDDNINEELIDKLYRIANYKQIPIIKTRLHSSKYEIIALNE